MSAALSRRRDRKEHSGLLAGLGAAVSVGKKNLLQGGGCPLLKAPEPCLGSR